jgi:hypothetical protein
MKISRQRRALRRSLDTAKHFRENSRGLDRQTVKLTTFKKQHPRSEGIAVLRKKIFLSAWELCAAAHRTDRRVESGSSRLVAIGLILTNLGRGICSCFCTAIVYSLSKT